MIKKMWVRPSILITWYESDDIIADDINLTPGVSSGGGEWGYGDEDDDFPTDF